MEEMEKINREKNIDYSYVKDIIPNEWQYKILKSLTWGKTIKKTEITLKLALHSIDEIKSWIQALEEKTHSVYSIRSTEKCCGDKVIFKQRLFCRHNTRSKKKFNLDLKSRTRNTNCPSYITITLKAVKAKGKYRGKPENAPDPKMPCIINFVPTHDHEGFEGREFRFRKVSEATKLRLLMMFQSGHTPLSAFQTLQLEIQSNHNNYEQLWEDRSICPDYNYCYYLYMKKNKNEDIETDSGQENSEAESHTIENLEENILELGNNDAGSSAENETKIFYLNDDDNLEMAVVDSDIQVEEALEQCSVNLNELFSYFANFANASPQEVLPALTKMNEKLKKLKTVRGFTKSCNAFSSAGNRIQSSIVNQSKLNVQCDEKLNSTTLYDSSDFQSDEPSTKKVKSVVKMEETIDMSTSLIDHSYI